MSSFWHACQRIFLNLWHYFLYCIFDTFNSSSFSMLKIPICSWIFFRRRPLLLITQCKASDEEGFVCLFIFWSSVLFLWRHAAVHPWSLSGLEHPGFRNRASHHLTSFSTRSWNPALCQCGFLSTSKFLSLCHVRQTLFCVTAELYP